MMVVIINNEMMDNINNDDGLSIHKAMIVNMNINDG